jgi:CDP-ribitol ribitolphosphotransferase
LINIVVFGTGSSSEKFVSDLDVNSVRILKFVDNNSSKHFQEYMECQIIPPSNINSLEFDYIVIASQYTNEIMQQLLSLGVPYSKIVPADSNLHHQEIRTIHENIHSKIKKNVSKRKKGKLKIAITNYNNSHSNGYALYKNIPPFISTQYEVDLISEKNLNVLNQYDVICSSNHEGIYDGNKINIEMWHGFPIKRMGVMHEEHATEEFLAYQEKRGKNIDLIMSYSHLYTTFFNSCYPNNSNKYRLTGMPRNDLLFEEGSVSRMERIIGNKLADNHIVFYMPTWRKGQDKSVDSNREWSQLFGFTNETEDGIIRMIEENNLFLVVKLHPFEYEDWKDLSIFKHDKIYLLSDETLVKENIHLYELMSCAEVLITDYSSIYFDTLLVDIPVLFAPTDLDEYGEKRGFLLDPYQYLTPGPTSLSINELEIELVKCINGIDEYKNQRQMIKSLVFKHHDNQSSLRVWREIDKFLSEYCDRIDMLERNEVIE